MDRAVSLFRNAFTRDGVGRIAYFTGQVGKRGCPGITVSFAIGQHCLGNAQFPARTAGFHIFRAAVGESLFRVIIYSSQTFFLRHSRPQSFFDRRRQQSVQLSVSGGVTSAAVQRKAFHFFVVVKTAAAADVEQFPADVVPALCEIDCPRLMRSPAFFLR